MALSTKKNKCTKGWSDYLRLDFHSECVCDRDLSGRVAIVTGANSGIGLEVCAALADKGAEVIMACRNKDRAEKALAKLKEENPRRNLAIELVDISNMQSVREFAGRINAKYEVIDILVNNAGAITEPTVTSEGFEIHFATNHLGHFLLTNLLLEKLKKSEDGRVVNVSSAAHTWGQYDPDTFTKAITLQLDAYGNTKLCNVLFTKELARRLRGTTVSTFSLHPGAIRTEITRHVGGTLRGNLMTAAFRFGGPFLKTNKQGAQTTLHAILNDSLRQNSGAYLAECEIARCSALAEDMEKARDLWQRSAQFTGLSN